MNLNLSQTVLLHAAQRAFCLAAFAILACLPAGGQLVPSNDPPLYGPYNGTFLADGLGIRTPLQNPQDTVLLPYSPWTLSCWFKTADAPAGLDLLAGVGDVTGEYPRYLALEPGRVALWAGNGNEFSGAAVLKPGEWHLLTATFDGARFHLYSDGAAVVSGALTQGTATAVLQMAPPLLSQAQKQHFAGQIASFVLLRRALSDAEVKQMQRTPPDFSIVEFDEGSKPWPFQTRSQAGYQGPQDPAQMPTSRAPFGKPVALKRAPGGDSLVATAPQEWSFADGWTLREAPKVNAAGAQLATASFPGNDWMRATVPGTVLTTLIDDGVYLDPDYGLNNLLIPETLNKQDYWYRNVFTLPAGVQSALSGPAGHVELTFQGINYQAAVWLNGSLLGTLKGAFRRGNFDVTSLLKPGEKNVLAVRISPPPHPGIPQEQSIRGGPGENGGAMELDGPTFLATEGWDWIPAIRDRDSGIWQPVTLTVTHQLSIGDAQVVSTFKNHDTTQATLAISVPVTNFSGRPVDATISARLESVAIHKIVSVQPGFSVIKLLPGEFPELNLQHPRLWWPNGYGKPELYTLKLDVSAGNESSDTKQIRFGVREVSYELSLLDSTGHLRRVEFTPSQAMDAAKPIVDVSHAGMRGVPGADAIALGIVEDHREDYQYHSVVSSLAPGADSSPAIERSSDTGPAPYLVIKVNGIRIAARGGNWGMDDARKRVSRAHLEPFFRLDRDANMNIIRNWVGQSTEQTFYDLADEYGIMIWNDFWESTQNYNIEAEDPQLFLDNAADTIRHFRNHPSIVLWCGRNEGVPQPIINQGLEELVRTQDGTRFYSPSSNQVNLQQSGPYSYQDPSMYYTVLNRGFSVETGTPSMSTLESFQSTTPEADQWPIDDVWAYHDWHSSGNGRTAPFMSEIEAEFGASTSLADFERKAQMLNYVDHRAIFEGMNANLWTPNSGRMLWMTQPAWPSTMWQILSSDYDTQASFYGSMKGAEPLHVQLNLSNYQVDVVNTTTEARAGVQVSAKVYSLSNALLLQKTDQSSLGADEAMHSFTLDLAPLLQRGMVLVELQLADGAGKELSRNLYWLAAKPAAYRELNSLASVPLEMTALATRAAGETIVTVQLTNSGTVAALENKLTLLGADKSRILPAYFSDNYISLLPGETRTLQIRFPEETRRRQAEIALRGWNAAPQTLQVQLPR